jgi:uncharacterized lipoprotein YmbA
VIENDVQKNLDELDDARVDGCSALVPWLDPSRYFTLAALARPEEAGTKEPAGGADALLGIGPIRFPDYLDRPELATRSSPNRFEVAENDRWAEPLEENFARVLARNLAALMRTVRIAAYPWAADRRPARQMEIEVLRFEITARTRLPLIRALASTDGPPLENRFLRKFRRLGSRRGKFGRGRRGRPQRSARRAEPRDCESRDGSIWRSEMKSLLARVSQPAK